MRWLLITLLTMLVAACATPYRGVGGGGGFSETQLEPGIWRVYFNANDHTTRETVQTYWLYRSAEIALQRGYDGFEILPVPYLAGTLPKGVQVAANLPYLASS